MIIQKYIKHTRTNNSGFRLSLQTKVIKFQFLPKRSLFFSILFSLIYRQQFEIIRYSLNIQK